MRNKLFSKNSNFISLKFIIVLLSILVYIDFSSCATSQTKASNSTDDPHSHAKLSMNFVGSITYTKLLPVLSQCFFVIVIGYICARFDAITATDADGLNAFVIRISLPALIFFAVSNTDLRDIKWNLLWCITLAKIIIFAVVVITTYILTSRDKGKAGIYGLFCTHSNDFCIGLPLLAALYDTKPILINHIYLLSPIQFIFLDPIGFLLMELQRKTNTGQFNPNLKKRFMDALVSGVILNPIVVMTILGVIANAIFRHNLPLVIGKIAEVLGKAFPGTGLFLLGHSLYGKCSILGCNIILPVTLVLMKILVLPLVIRGITQLSSPGQTPEETRELSNFGFLYGILPTSPAVFIFATQFDQATDVIATGLVIGTILSAPLVFITASMTLLSIFEAIHFHAELLETVFYCSIISLLCTIWVILVMLIERKWRRITHRITLCIAISQFFVALGGILCATLNLKNPSHFYIQYIINIGGKFASLIWTGILAILLTFICRRGLCFALRTRHYLVIYGSCCIFFLIITLSLTKTTVPNINTDLIIWSQYGETEMSIALGITLLSFITILVCLVIQRYYYSYKNYQNSDYQSLITLGDESSDTDAGHSHVESKSAASSRSAKVNNFDGPNKEVPDMEDFGGQGTKARSTPPLWATFPLYCEQNFNCSAVQRTLCVALVRKYVITLKNTIRDLFIYDDEESHQIVRHVTLLILLSVGMAVSLTDFFWRLAIESTSGIYIELEFLDAILHYGQGMFTLIMFGFDTKLIKGPAVRFWRHFCPGKALVLPEIEELPPQVQASCRQFANYHFEKCCNELTAQDLNPNAKKKYKDSFSGVGLVTWIVDAGLTRDRVEASNYGESLLLGRLIEHVKRKMHFYDALILYKFNKDNLDLYKK